MIYSEFMRLFLWAFLKTKLLTVSHFAAQNFLFVVYCHQVATIYNAIYQTAFLPSKKRILKQNIGILKSLSRQCDLGNA